MTIVVKCPRCGTESKVANAENRNVHVILCYPEDGGCDQYFAVRVWIEPSWETAPVDFPSMKQDD